MLLAPMDGIVNYRCGVDFIAVRLTNNVCGCCAYVHVHKTGGAGDVDQ